jgi:hypothetical protein
VGVSLQGRSKILLVGSEVFLRTFSASVML